MGAYDSEAVQAAIHAEAERAANQYGSFDISDDPTVAYCNGAPDGFEADCGVAGAHGPHEIGNDEPRDPVGYLGAVPVHPIGAFFRALADAYDEGAPALYAVGMASLNNSCVMQLYSVKGTEMQDLLWWADRLGAEHVEIKHRYSEHGDRFAVRGTIGGRAVEIWDVINVTGAEGSWSETVPAKYLADSYIDR